MSADSPMSSLSTKPFPTIASAISSTLSLLEYDSEALFKAEIDIQKQLLADIARIEEEAQSSLVHGRDCLLANAGRAFFAPMSPLTLQQAYDQINPSVQRLISSLTRLIGSKNELFQLYYRNNSIFTTFILNAVRTLITKTHLKNGKAFGESVEILLDLFDLEPVGRLSKETAEYYQIYLNDLLVELKDYLKDKFDLKDALKVEDFQDDVDDESAATAAAAAHAPPASSSVQRDDHLTLFQIMKLNQLASKKELGAHYMHKIFKLIYYCFSCVSYERCKEFLRIAIEILIVYASADRLFSLDIIDVFIERNKNTIVNNDDSYRITLNRAPFSIIARYLVKCYFANAAADEEASEREQQDFPFDPLERVTPASLFQMRVKCLTIVQKYVAEVSHNIDSLNLIGGQNFALILHNYEKKICQLVLTIARVQVVKLADHSLAHEEEVDLAARLLVECLQALRTYTSYRTDYFMEKLHQLFDLLVRALNSRCTAACKQARSEVYKYFIAAITEKTLRMNVFLMHHWPRLRPIWAQDLAQVSSQANGSLVLIECLCKNAGSSMAKEHFAVMNDVCSHFARSMDPHMTDEPLIQASLDAINSLIDLLGKYCKSCQAPAADRHLVTPDQLQAFKRSVAHLLEGARCALSRLRVMPFFRVSLKFYSKLFAIEKPEIPLFEEDRVWHPHVDLLMKQLDACNEIYQAKSTFVLEAFLSDKFLDVFSLISGLNYYFSTDYLKQYKHELLTFMSLLRFDEAYQKELLRSYEQVFENF